MVGLASFTLLWLLNTRYRLAYQPDADDVTALADGLLLVPGASWVDWFIHGHSDFFDTYPDWPWGVTPFARPAFQFLIYVAHILLGRDWSSYLSINYLGIAAIGAIAFVIARTALRLGPGASLVAAVLVLVSPAVLQFSIWRLGFASESLTSALVGCAFLAVVARRDFLCSTLLMVALMTKETAIWAPFAAALTVMLRSDPGETVRRRVLTASAMLLPVVLWVGLRVTFFGGLGGGYATEYVDYYLPVLLSKLTHPHRFLVSGERFAWEGIWSTFDRALVLGTSALVALLLLLWILSSLRAARDELNAVRRERSWPAVDPTLLVSLWAGLGFACTFAITVDRPRFAAAAVLFVWPAVVHSTLRYRKAALNTALGVCLILPLARTSHLLNKYNPPSSETYPGWQFHGAATINAALRDVPSAIRQVYVITQIGLPRAAPKYIQAFLSTEAEIIRLADFHETCPQPTPFLAIDHGIDDGLVTLTAKVREDCAIFFFDLAGPGSTHIIEGTLRRNDTISYDLPEGHLIDHKGRLKPALDPGTRLIAYVRPKEPARFIIEQGAPDGGVTWFDTP